MKKNSNKITFYIFLMLTLYASKIHAQNEKSDETNKTYRASATKVNALVHTKLDVRFDYTKQYLYGKEWVTLKPYAYATDSLTLDAKGMDIKTVALSIGKTYQNLKYKYDGLQLKIQLGKKFLAGEPYVIYLDYTSKPNDFKAPGSAAITDAKGLYFINPDSSVKGKPVQIWTQGETESSSVWFPTIDKPNQKTTSEISITIPKKYVTLSNGKLATQVKNANGTRTDTWKMELPHSPYLFMMAVGNFKVYKDKYKTKEVNYYLEPEFAPYAKQIFGSTPEIIALYSKLLGIDYPWNKYSQVVVRDYVSGAMENTTATLHGEQVQRTPREMLDENYGIAESTIAHELFHQWFGDYVTLESWSNLTVNESFANYSEVLWAEHKYGQDAADDHNNNDLESYLGSGKAELNDLVRFHYKDKEDLFDLVSYNKGGRILNMMRHFLGDEVFFKGLNIYLKQNAFKNGEVHQLRLAMEEASGKDMNWFFNQWYFNAGHPIVTIDYTWDEANKIQKVTLRQTQSGKLFTLPMAVDVYIGKNKQRYQITFTDSIQTFSFLSSAKPDLVNVDAEKVMLWEKSDHKSLNEYVFQYANAPLYIDRLEALSEAGKNKKTSPGFQILLSALNDKYFGLRAEALDSLDLSDIKMAAKALPIIRKMAATDPNTTVQAAAIKAIADNKNEADLPTFRKALENKSYAVQGAALQALALQKPEDALLAAKALEKDSRGALTEAILMIYAKFGSEQNFPFVAEKFSGMDLKEKVSLLPAYLGMAANANNTIALQKAIDESKSLGLKYKRYGADKYIINLLTQLKQQTEAGKANADYIDAALTELNK